MKSVKCKVAAPLGEAASRRFMCQPKATPFGRAAVLSRRTLRRVRTRALPGGSCAPPLHGVAIGFAIVTAAPAESGETPLPPGEPRLFILHFSFYIPIAARRRDGESRLTGWACSTHGVGMFDSRRFWVRLTEVLGPTHGGFRLTHGDFGVGPRTKETRQFCQGSSLAM